MSTEWRTLGLILVFAAAAWAAAGALLPHAAALIDGLVVPEAAMFTLVAIRVGLLGARSLDRRANGVSCGVCVWDGTRQVCAC